MDIGPVLFIEFFLVPAFLFPFVHRFVFQAFSHPGFFHDRVKFLFALFFVFFVIIQNLTAQFRIQRIHQGRGHERGERPCITSADLKCGDRDVFLLCDPFQKMIERMLLRDRLPSCRKWRFLPGYTGIFLSSALKKQMRFFFRFFRSFLLRSRRNKSQRSSTMRRNFLHHRSRHVIGWRDPPHCLTGTQLDHHMIVDLKTATHVDHRTSPDCCLII